MKKLLLASGVLLLVSTPVLAQQRLRPDAIQPNMAPVSATANVTGNNTDTFIIPENTSLNQGGYVAVPLDAPLTPIGGGMSTENGGMNLNSSRVGGIGR